MKTDKISLKILIGLVAVIWAILVYYLNGFVIVKMWSWFVVPVFNIVQITILQAIGLSFLTMFMCNNLPDNPKTETLKEKINQFTIPIIRPLITLLAGWIVTLIM